MGYSEQSDDAQQRVAADVAPLRSATWLNPSARPHQETPWQSSGRVTGLHGQRVEIAMLRTPDGHSRIELSRFDAPAIAEDHRKAPVNSLGHLRVMFTVDNIDDTVARLERLGASVVGEVVD